MKPRLASWIASPMVLLLASIGLLTAAVQHFAPAAGAIQTLRQVRPEAAEETGRAVRPG